MGVDRKASDLLELATPAAGDYLKIVDISEPLVADKDKRVLWSTIQALAAAGNTALQPADLNTLAELNALIADATLGDSASFAPVVHGHAIADVTNLQTTLDAKADLVGGLIPTAQLPALAITEFLGIAADQTALLLLSGQRGDWALRTDTGSTWVLVADGGALITDWQEYNYPAAPVTSVNGQTGVVVLGAADVGAAPAGSGAFTADVNTQITPSTAIVLGQATGDEVALDLSFTVNKAAGNYGGIKCYATETSAPGTDDRLLDLGVGAVSKETTTNSGQKLLRTNGTAALPALSIGATLQAGLFKNYGLAFIYNGVMHGEVSPNGLTVINSLPIGWTNDANAAVADPALWRDAAGIINQRNGVNAQTHRVTKTYTNSSNYEWLAIKGDSITVETAGTGADDIDLTLTPAGAGGINITNFAELVTAYTVATLPATPVVGMMARVTDATAPAVGSAVSGGGAAHALCWYNNAGWTVIGV